MHNLTYSVNSMPRNSLTILPPIPVARSRNSSDKRNRHARTEKDFFALNTYKIAMMEVFEKQNDLSKTRPFNILVSSNIALSAQKYAHRRRLVKLEGIYSQKLLCHAVVSELSKKFEDGGAGVQASPALKTYFEQNRGLFPPKQERTVSAFDILCNLIFHNTELKNREALQDLISMPMFRETIEELDRALLDQFFYREGPGSLRDRLLKTLKSLLKALGPKVLVELARYKVIEKTLSTPFEDKAADKTRNELRKALTVGLSSESATTGRTADHSRSHPHPSHGSHTPATHASGSHPANMVNGIPKPDAAAVVPQPKVKQQMVYCHSLNDPELTGLQRQQRKELSYYVFKDPSFQALMTPYFDLSAEPTFYQNYIDRTFLHKEHVPPTFEQVATYFPNYHLLRDLVHKTLPTREDIDKTTFVLHSLFHPQELYKNPTFEDYIDRILALVESQNRDFLPYLLSEDNYLRHIISEICARKMVLINLTRNEIRCQSLSSIDDPFFAPLPSSLKHNPRILFYVYQAHRTYTSSLELALASLNNHYFMQPLGLNLETLVRLTTFTKFLLGDKVYLVYDHRFPADIVFRETMRAFGEAPDDLDAKTKEQYKEFMERLKGSSRVDVAEFFSKKKENRMVSYQENLVSLLSKTSHHPTDTHKSANFLLESSKDSAPRLVPVIDRRNRFDLKKMQTFKKVMKIG